MRSFQNRKYVLPALSLLAVALIAGAWWWKDRHTIRYVPEGYGGYVMGGGDDVKRHAPADPLKPVLDAYNSRKYKQAEKEAQKFIDSSARSRDPEVKERAVTARRVLAYSAARQKDMKLAQERFAVLRTEAAKLPDDKDNASPVTTATIEEDAAYQHAVCTAALGDKKAAEAEYIKFMKDYPESSLVTPALTRVEMLHGGKAPAEANAAWKRARKISATREKVQFKQQTRCGPDCLAELLRRKGAKADVDALATEMETDRMGTTLQALADSAKKSGFSPQGLKLTWNGLMKQPLPLIALARPGHYVIVDRIAANEVYVWDPMGEGPGKPARRVFSKEKWMGGWTGIALVLN